MSKNYGTGLFIGVTNRLLEVLNFGDEAPVHEIFQGKSVWKGEVEVFDLIDHPKAKRCYGWSHPSGENDQDERFVTVLEIPPVKSAATAVRVSIMADSKTP